MLQFIYLPSKIKIHAKGYSTVSCHFWRDEDTEYLENVKKNVTLPSNSFIQAKK